MQKEEYQYDDQYTEKPQDIHQTNIRPPETIRYLNVLELLDSRNTIYHIALKMSGLREINIGGLRSFERIGVPQFTDEFTDKIISEFYIFSNPITAQTWYEKEEISLFLRHKFNNVINLYITRGRDNFITEDTWQRILDIHRNKIPKKRRVGQNENGQTVVKIVHVSGWYNILNREWNPNANITRQMLKHVKSSHEISDFGIILTNDILEQYWLIFSALNRSLKGLTLDHHQNIERVSQVIKDKEKKGILGTISERASNIGKGGGR